MRNVIFAINITLDGCCDHTKQMADEETHEYFTHLMRDVDLLVFGRKTYQLMVPFWPEVAKTQSMTKASNEFAQTFDSINKIVFSRSLGSAEDSSYCSGWAKGCNRCRRCAQPPMMTTWSSHGVKDSTSLAKDANSGFPFMHLPY
jgi:hypothetical protein